MNENELRTSAPTYYRRAAENLRNRSVPISWVLGDCEPVVTLSLDRDGLVFLEDCVRRAAETDGFAGEIQAIRERVDRVIAGWLSDAEGDVHTAAQAVAILRERYGVLA